MFLSWGVQAQTKDTIKSNKAKHTTIYDNQLKVIYDEENGEYSGVKVNRKPVSENEQTQVYRPLMLLPPPEMTRVWRARTTSCWLSVTPTWCTSVPWTWPTSATRR